MKGFFATMCPAVRLCQVREDVVLNSLLRALKLETTKLSVFLIDLNISLLIRSQEESHLRRLMAKS